MREQYVVAIDSGTQSTRVAIFDTQGNRLATGSSQHPAMSTPTLGWFEHGKQDSWNALQQAAKNAFAKFSGDKSKIVGIAVSSQRICVNILGNDGKPIHNPISWMDCRWKMNFASIGQLTEKPDVATMGFLTYFSLANWMKYNDAETYKNAAKYLNVTGYLGYLLTGEFRDSLANNIGWPYDETDWTGLLDDKYIAMMGLRRDQLAEPVLPGGLIGHITAEAAAQTGFPVGCQLYASGGDKQCELLGASAVNHGQAYITLGTLSGMDVVSTEYKPSPSFAYSTYLAAYPKNYNYEAPLGKGFWLVSWFRDNFGMDLKEEAAAKGLPIEALLDAEAEKIAPGAEGLVVLPDWAGAGGRPHSKGMFIGFDSRHTRAHLYRALIEGIIMELKSKADSMLDSLGMSIDKLYIGGGGSKSNFCAQAIADVFNVPVHRSQESENCSLGTAICAAVGCGIYATLDEGIEKMAKKFDVFYPNADNHACYAALREKVIDRLYPGVEDALKDLAEISNRFTATK